jgi:small-conductance mechanosensitive channel
LYFGTHDAITLARPNEKEEQKMKTTLSRKAAYIGAGAGLVLFAIFGLLPGSLLGGAAGIKFAGMLFGLPLEPGIVSRSIVLLSMLLGVMVSGIAIVTATSTAGWLVGNVLGATTDVLLHTGGESVSIRRD